MSDPSGNAAVYSDGEYQGDIPPDHPAYNSNDHRAWQDALGYGGYGSDGYGFDGGDEFQLPSENGLASSNIQARISTKAFKVIDKTARTCASSKGCDRFLDPAVKLLDNLFKVKLTRGLDRLGRLLKGRGKTVEKLPEVAQKMRPHRHHLFSRNFREFFKGRGINIDHYTVTLGRTAHLKGCTVRA